MSVFDLLEYLPDGELQYQIWLMQIEEHRFVLPDEIEKQVRERDEQKLVAWAKSFKKGKK